MLQGLKSQPGLLAACTALQAEQGAQMMEAMRTWATCPIVTIGIGVSYPASGDPTVDLGDGLVAAKYFKKEAT